MEVTRDKRPEEGWWAGNVESDLQVVLRLIHEFESLGGRAGVSRVVDQTSGELYRNTPPVRTISSAIPSACWMKRFSMALI